MVEVQEEIKIKHEDFFNNLRNAEYSRLDKDGHVYLDYTGGNQYAASQITKHLEMLQNEVLGNPHSKNPTSKRATVLTSKARNRVIEYFRAEDYFCVFTMNATHALKIVGEGYPFSKNGYFMLLTDNHNSVNGIREYAKEYNAGFNYVRINVEDLCINKQELLYNLKSHNDKENKLFAFPAQSNVTGVKHDLKWIEIAQNEGWDVLVDAAAYVPSSRLDLSKVKPDFVSVSFYKIFGYPTGIGCLLVKKSKFNKLVKHWYAGGNVTMASAVVPHHFLEEDHQRFEDGTINYLDIPAVKIGLDYIDSIGIEKIGERVCSLTSYLCSELQKLYHTNGKQIIKTFGPKNRKNSGATVIMSILDSEGKLYPYAEFEEFANTKMISIRSGCFCNPGIDEISNCISTKALSDYFASRDQGNCDDVMGYLSKMRGATRVSLGIASTKADVDIFIEFIKSIKDKKVEEVLNF
jgi:selenocysteine lyase/cysteine desulfurase